MVSIVDRFRKNAPKRSIHSTKIKKAGCSLKKTSLPDPYIFIDLDHLGKIDASKCADFLFATDGYGGWIVSIEMKRGNPDVVKSAKQIQSTIRIFEDWVDGVTSIIFQPLLVSGSLSIHERKNLSHPKNEIHFRGDKYPILRIRCQSALSQIFE